MTEKTCTFSVQSNKEGRNPLELRPLFWCGEGDLYSHCPTQPQRPHKLQQLAVSLEAQEAHKTQANVQNLYVSVSRRA